MTVAFLTHTLLLRSNSFCSELICLCSSFLMAAVYSATITGLFFLQKDFDLATCLLPTGNWPLLPGGRWHPGGPDDPAQAIRACHCCLQAQHRQVGGRPSANPGISGV